MKLLLLLAFAAVGKYALLETEAFGDMIDGSDAKTKYLNEWLDCHNKFNKAFHF